MTSKKNLRQRLRQQRLSLSTDSVAQLSQQICCNIIATNEYKKAHCIGCYIAFQNEVDLSTLIQQALQDNKLVCLPIVNNESVMIFHRYANDTILKPGQFGISEPQQTPVIKRQQIDLLIVPLVGFDEKGNRLGQGCGYYDRYLESADDNITTIGVGYEIQKTTEIPVDPWDIKLDKIISENGITQ